MTTQKMSLTKRAAVTVGFAAALFAGPALVSVGTATEAFAQPNVVTVGAENHSRQGSVGDSYTAPVYLPHVNATVHQSR
jgi:hypothetical protein